MSTLAPLFLAPVAETPASATATTTAIADDDLAPKISHLLSPVPGRAARVAADIMKQDRKYALLVLTTDRDGRLNWDVSLLGARLDGRVKTVVLVSGTETREFEAALPENCRVFGGNAKVYGPVFQGLPAQEVVFVPRSRTATRDAHTRLVERANLMAALYSASE